MRGETGDAGENGKPGTAGPDGSKGSSGRPGLRGRDGRQGDHGTKGSQGPRGNQGAKGDDGERGDKGSMGPQGIYGPAGDAGEKGNTGEPGPDGPVGPQGVRGSAGPDGGRGRAGAKGIDGQFGRKGNRGQSGANGDSGKPGTPGGPGVAGQPGSPGEISGISGAFARFFTAGGLGMKGPGRAASGYNQQYKYYQAAGKTDPSINRHYDNFKTYYNMLKTFDKVTMGSGQRSDPARTCAELFKWYPQKQSSDYWVDPNEGASDDSVLVYCHKETNETCVYPKISTVSDKYTLTNFRLKVFSQIPRFSSVTRNLIPQIFGAITISNRGNFFYRHNSRKVT